MHFDDFDQKMRVYETAHDHCVMPNIHMVARLDGRNFTRLTKEIHSFEAPFDERFRNYMLDTVEHLMTCGFQVIYGFAQSDEISLLFHLDEQAFGRKTRKFNSILAGEASAKFSLLLGGLATFDCRICQLPNCEIVLDYFRWRQEDAHKNALNGHCYWLLRRQGKTVADATKALVGLSVADKNELLFQNGINFNDLPNWQKRGVGLSWEPYTKTGLNPKIGLHETSTRRHIKRHYDLPMKDEYAQFIQLILDRQSMD